MRASIKLSIYLLFICCLFVLGSTLSFAEESIGFVAVVKGDVTLVKDDGTEEPLVSEQKVFESDTIVTGKRARVQIILNDDSVFTVGRNSIIKLEEFVYNSETEQGKAKLDTKQGIIKFVTGKIAKAQPQNVKIKTPFATIGVRGSGGIVQVSPNGQTLVGLTQCCLDVSANGANSTPVPLNNVNDFSQVDDPNQPPTSPQPMTPQVRAQLDAALDGGVEEEGVEESSSDANDEESSDQEEASKEEENGSEEGEGEEVGEPEQEEEKAPLERVETNEGDEPNEPQQESQPFVEEQQPPPLVTQPLTMPINFVPEVVESVVETAVATSQEDTTQQTASTGLEDVKEQAELESFLGANLNLDNTSGNFALNIGFVEKGVDVDSIIRIEARDLIEITPSGMIDIQEGTALTAVQQNELEMLKQNGVSGADANASVRIPNAVFSTGYVKNDDTGAFYKVTSIDGSEEFRDTYIEETNTAGNDEQVDGIKISYQTESAGSGNSSGYDSLTVKTGTTSTEFDPDHKEQIVVDNKSYAMSLEEVVLDNGGTTTRLVNDNATENLQGGMVSNVGLLPTAEELCPSCLSSHWGVIAGEMKRTDLGDIKDVFYLIPYVAGTTAATDFIGNIAADFRKVNYTGGTFGSIIEYQTGATNPIISQHTGNMTLAGTFGIGLEFNATLGPKYKLQADIDTISGNDALFSSNSNYKVYYTNGGLDYIFDNADTALDIGGAFFGNNGQEVGGDFSFDVKDITGDISVAAAGIFQGILTGHTGEEHNLPLGPFIMSMITLDSSGEYDFEMAERKWSSSVDSENRDVFLRQDNYNIMEGETSGQPDLSGGIAIPTTFEPIIKTASEIGAVYTTENANNAVTVPTAMYSAGFVELRAGTGSGEYYKVSSNNPTNSDFIDNIAADGIVDAAHFMYQVNDVNSAEAPGSSLEVQAGSIVGTAYTSFDNASYAMRVGNIKTDASIYSGASSVSMIISKPAITLDDGTVTSICNTCEFAHWGVWVGDFYRPDPLGSGNYDRARLVPYVAGQMTTVSQMVSIAADSRGVNYTGETFGSIIDGSSISHHVGDMTMTGTLGTSLNFEATLDDYRMEKSFSHSAGVNFSISDADLYHQDSLLTDDAAINGVFFGPNAQEVGGNFSFNDTINNKEGAGIFLGEDDNR